MFLIAPTEPAELRQLGITSTRPERHGCDVVWNTSSGELAGVQRKTLADLWSSVGDGRLAREVDAMGDLAARALVVEGRVRWSARGRLATAASPLTRDQLRGLLISVQQRGIIVVHSDDLSETVAAVCHLRRWLDKGHHPTLELRPPAGRTAWGIYLLQSFPGIGPVVAANLHAHFGGVPLAWTCTPSELGSVRGVGPKRAATLWSALAHGPERLEADVGP